MSSAVPTPEWVRWMPATFVFLWATGFIGAKYGLPYAPPATLLVLRFIFVIALLLPIAVALRAPWPATRRQVFTSPLRECCCTLAILLASLGPFTRECPRASRPSLSGCNRSALAGAPLLGERVTTRQWFGLALGFGGMALVVWQRVSLGGLSAFSFGMCLLALVSITIGTVYQKRFCGAFDLRSGAVVQFVAATLVLAPFALAFEDAPVRWTGEFVFAMAWLVLVLSIGAISLLALLIRRGAATKVASLFYLVPPVTALLAFFLFRETLGPIALAGFLLAVAGVGLVVRT